MSDENYTPSFGQAAGVGSSFALIPHGTLAWGIIEAKDTKQSKSGGHYIDITVHITEGPFTGRKIFSIIMDPFWKGNSKEAKQMGEQALVRICETCGIFNFNDLANGYKALNGKNIFEVADIIDGKKVAIKIKLEKGKDGYEDKNTVGDWLSPYPASNGHPGFLKLTTGAGPAAAAAPPFSSPAAAPAAAASSPVVSFAAMKAARAAGGGTPNWLANAQAAAPAPVVAPAVVAPAPAAAAAEPVLATPVEAPY